MSNSDVFGSPMILTGNRPVSPFGAAPHKNPDKRAGKVTSARIGHRLLQALCSVFNGNTRERRVQQTVETLSQLDNRTLRDIGLDRSAIISSARQTVDGHRVNGRARM